MMKRALGFVLALMLAGCVTVPVQIVHLNPLYGGDCEVVCCRASRTKMTYVFGSETGVFSFDVSPPPLWIKRVCFVFTDQPHLASLSLQPVGGAWANLYEPGVRPVPGIDVVKFPSGWRATFSGSGLDLLRQGGRFQVINQWRE